MVSNLWRGRAELWHNMSYLSSTLWTIIFLRPYFEGQRLRFRTENGDLKWIHNLTDSTGQLDRQRLHLLEFDFHLVNEVEIKNEAVDAWSQLKPEEMGKALSPS